MRKSIVFLTVLALFVFSLLSLSVHAEDGEEGDVCTTDSECPEGYYCDQGECKASVSTCGDGSCDSTEDVSSCPEDCSVCGDGKCTGNENESNCASDCYSPPSNETYDPCPDDECPGKCCEYELGERCGYRSDGSPNYCPKGDVCVDSEKGWCCPEGKKVCPGDDKGMCVDNDFVCTRQGDPCPDDECPGYCCAQEPERKKCLDDSDCAGWEYCDEKGFCLPRKEDLWCGNGICELEEDSVSCPQDCGPKEGWCGDGICDEYEDRVGCPQDCGRMKYEVAEDCFIERRGGKDVVVCEKRRREFSCPGEENIEIDEENCKRKGGNPFIKKDSYGCKSVVCDFSKMNERFVDEERDWDEGRIFRKMRCPTEEELSEIVRKCKETGGNPSLIESGGGFGVRGCRVITCNYMDKMRGPDICAEYDNPGIKIRFYDSCGGFDRTVVDLDESGCPITRCGDPQTECLREFPQEAYDRCPGELILETDENGCIRKFDCIFRGGKEHAVISSEEIKEVPDISIVLKLALKLEGMNTKFIELAEKIEKLEKFYKRKADSATNEEVKKRYMIESKRFRKAADLMLVAATNVDNIRKEIGSVASKKKITEVDVINIKIRIKSLKEEVIRDVIFALVGDPESVAKEYNIDVTAEAIEEEDIKVTFDGFEFDYAFRSCTPIIFYPEGMTPDGKGVGPKVIIKGLDDKGNCIMKVDATDEFNSGRGPPKEFIEFVAQKNNIPLQKDPNGNYIIDMVCVIPDYQNGIPEGADGPPKDYMKKRCTGLMLNFMEMGPRPAPGPNKAYREPHREEEYGRPEPVPHREEEYGRPEYGAYGEEYEEGPRVNEPEYYQRGGGLYDEGQKCPDGVCDYYESQGGICPEDCGY